MGKALEDWNSKHGFTFNRDNPRHTIEFERERAWKAALEFVVRDLCCGCNYTSDDVKKDIEKELEEK